MPTTTTSDTQTHTSRYGRDPITVSIVCPTGSIRWKLGHVHVATPDEEVEEMISEAVTARIEAGDADWTAELGVEAVRFALWAHAENLAEYHWVMGPH